MKRKLIVSIEITDEEILKDYQYTHDDLIVSDFENNTEAWLSKAETIRVKIIETSKDTTHDICDTAGFKY